jgi:uncharacterized membrane protein
VDDGDGAMTTATGAGEAPEVEQVDGSSGGLEPNVAGALAYLFAPIGGVAMYVMGGDDEFVRFHALQGIAFGVVAVAIWLGMFLLNTVVTFVLGDIPFLGLISALVSLLLTPVVGLVLFAAWAFLTYKAYKGERFVIPVLGSFATSR